MSFTNSLNNAVTDAEIDEIRRVAPNPIVEKALSEDAERTVRRYAKKHNVAPGQQISAYMLRWQYYIERELAKTILNSVGAERGVVAKTAYDTLFRECSWLRDRVKPPTEVDKEYTYLPRILKGFGRDVYEIGSGSGELAEFLHRSGFNCVATEISPETRTMKSATGIVWHTTDGVHLTSHERPLSYDIVISHQVLEHLHPDDIAEHCRHALDLLKPGGVYIFTTPSRLLGPRDITWVFDMEKSDCLHLKEYTHWELRDFVRQAGFSTVKAVYVAPNRIRRSVDIHFCSAAYLGFIIFIERFLERLPFRLRRSIARMLHLVAIMRPDIYLIARKA